MSRRYTPRQVRQARQQVVDWLQTIGTRTQRIGTSPSEQLWWLGDFVTQTLSAEQDLDEAASDVQWFVIMHVRAWAGDTRTAADLERLIAPGDVTSIQRAVRDTLQQLEPGGFVWWPQPVGDGVRWTSKGVVSVTKAEGITHILAAVADVLIQVGPRLRRCACGRLFSYTRPQQKRCHPNCGGTERVRAWRAKNRERVSEMSHAKYVRKVKAASPNVRVARRPRSAKTK